MTLLEGRRVAVSNEEKTITWEGPLDPDTELLMGKRKVAYFNARITELRQIAIGSEAGWQGW